MSLTVEQQDLRDAVRGLLGSAGATAGAAAGDSAWPRLCGEVGVAGLGIPVRYGGTGGGLAEVGVVMEELGRELVPAPMLGSTVLTASRRRRWAGRRQPARSPGSGCGPRRPRSTAARWRCGPRAR